MDGARWRLIPAVAMAAWLALSTAAAGLPENAAPPSWLGSIPGLGHVAPDPPPADAPVRLAGCTQAAGWFRDDPARVRRFVPAHCELGTHPYFGPGVATVFATALACDEASVAGGPASSLVLSMVAAQVRAAPTGDGDPADALWDAYNQSMLNLGPSASWYLIAAQTNNPAVGRLLDEAGLEVETVAGLVFRTDYARADKSDFLVVPSGNSPYQLQTTTMLPDCCFAHNHDWAFWHDGPKGTVGFLEHLHGMIESSCGYPYQVDRMVHAVRASCGATLEARPGTPVAEFLGSSWRETSFALNHPTSHARGYLTLLAGAGPDAPSERAAP